LFRLCSWCLSLVFCASALAGEIVHFPSLESSWSHSGPTILTGIMDKPEGAGPFPAVVLLHGCAGLFNRRTGRPEARLSRWAAYLRQHGYATLMVDSFDSRGATDRCPNAIPSVRSDRERPYDAYGALRYLQQQGFVDAGKVAVAGWSHGGGTVLYAIGSDSPARPAGLSADFIGAVAFYPGKCLSRQHVWRWHSTIPLLVLLGGLDNWSRAAPCKAFIEDSRERGTDAEVVVYPDAYHDFDAPASRVRTLAPMPGERSGPHILAPSPEATEAARIKVLSFLNHLLKKDQQGQP
jgi:dienelactone hydrolase